MHRNQKSQIIFLFALLSLFNLSKAVDIDYVEDDVDDDGRNLFPVVVGTGGTITLNITQLTGLASLLSSALIAGLALTALGFMIWAIVEHKYNKYSGSGYSGSGGYGDQGGYSSYSQYRSFGSGFNWDQFTILDAIAMAEDAYENFDPSDLQCQKRLICEIHQNASEFGYPAKTLVDTMSYLQYASVLSLPQEFKMLAEEYLDAADRGRNNIKECGEIYKTCKFSVKKITERLSHNEI